MAGRRIPAVMGTQHPDNARKPFWAQNAFLDTQDEVEECFDAFSELGCDEFMWDWEGKHVDESVVEKLLETRLDFFQEKQLGKDVFLTFRLPNIWEEKGYRVARAFVNIVAADDLAKELGLHTPPIFEAILPMTTSVEKMIFIQRNYARVARVFKDLRESGPDAIELIPLIEEVELIAKADELARKYANDYPSDELFKGRELTSLRVFIARSDPALNAGNVAAVLAGKLALSRLAEFSEEASVLVSPVIGVGCLPFRGGLSPDNVKEFCAEYSGVRTATVQSAFRYDYEKNDVVKAIDYLKQSLPRSKPRIFGGEEQTQATELMNVFSKNYRSEIEALAQLVNKIAAFVPARRERKLHIGLFGYSRSVNGVSLPRAIPFVCALYSIGLPPELIGVGSSLRECGNKASSVEDYYLFFRKDLTRAGSYLNKENLSKLASSNESWASACRKLSEEIKFIEEFLGDELGPVSEDDFIHRNITSNVRLLLKKGESVQAEITRAGELRKSLG